MFASAENFFRSSSNDPGTRKKTFEGYKWALHIPAAVAVRMSCGDIISDDARSGKCSRVAFLVVVLDLRTQIDVCIACSLNLEWGSV